MAAVTREFMRRNGVVRCAYNFDLRDLAACVEYRALNVVFHFPSCCFFAHVNDCSEEKL